MRTVVVYSSGRPEPIELTPGETVTFGRHGQDVDVELAGCAVPRLAGAITARDDFWLLSNYSRQSTYVVQNPHGAGEFLKLAPRRLDMPVPFEFADVLLPVDAASPVLRVLAPRHTYSDALPAPGRDSEPTVAAFPLDETSRYFAILVALCEPRLRDASSVVIPTVPEIIDRLHQAGLPPLTRAAVNFHIEYLARHKLRVKPAEGTGRKADWQRASLVTLALRFNLVNRQHLDLLAAPDAGDRATDRQAGTHAGSGGPPRRTGEPAAELPGTSGRGSQPTDRPPPG